MLKFIIIAAIFIYVVYKASDFILRMIDGITGGGRRVNSKQRGYSFGPESRRQQQRSRYQRPKGDVNIDYVPEDQKKKGRSSQDFKGGDYVDYEEVK